MAVRARDLLYLDHPAPSNIDFITQRPSLEMR